jgi:hypothetical protein
MFTNQQLWSSGSSLPRKQRLDAGKAAGWCSLSGVDTSHAQCQTNEDTEGRGIEGEADWDARRLEATAIPRAGNDAYLVQLARLLKVEPLQ